jgi:hypothetical protein
MAEDTWSDIAINSGAARRAVGGITGAQIGYCQLTLDELWAGAKEHFSMCIYDNAWRKRTQSLWRSKHYFYL